ATGPGLTPRWAVDKTSPGSIFFADPVSGADVNGDGISDLIIGSKATSQIFVYFGHVGTGPSSAAADETRPGSPGQGTTWAAGVGDLNGDGFADVATVDSSGTQVSVYLGGGYVPAATAGYASYEAVPTAAYGLGPATGGDINGDGFSDYVAGAPSYSNGQQYEGRFHVVYGGSCGPPCSFALNEPPPPSWESDQASAQQGWAVALVSDLNGDGYDDV